MSIFVSGAPVLTKQHLTTTFKSCKIIDFSELFIWLAREHQLSQLIDAPGGSCWLLGALWAAMVALGGSWRKYMKTILLFSKTYTFHSPGLFFGCPKSYILDHWEFMKAIVLLIPGSKARKSLNQASWDWFCRLLEPWPESHQIDSPGIRFLDLWSQGQKAIKSSLLARFVSSVHDTGTILHH